MNYQYACRKLYWLRQNAKTMAIDSDMFKKITSMSHALNCELKAVDSMLNNHNLHSMVGNYEVKLNDNI